MSAVRETVSNLANEPQFDQVVQASLTWNGREFKSGQQIAVRAGRIVAVGALGLEPTRRFADHALLPGMVNVHSHAFQRRLRGTGETFPSAAGTFWTWRDAMYSLVDRLDPRGFRDACLSTYDEMLSAGITCVGEFHYLHHSRDDPDYSFDDIVLDAAAEVGIRVVLLNTYYSHGGIGVPLRGAQRRFASAPVQGFWDNMQVLQSRLRSEAQTLGVAVHSVRAANLEELMAIHKEARARQLVFHIHAEEQIQEVAASLAEYGARPLELLNERFGDTSGCTVVHATHAAPDDIERWIGNGGHVAVCPLTEANLGDGTPDTDALAGNAEAVCLGTDSNLRISMIEEMRWLEYRQRLDQERRGVFTDKGGKVGTTLFDSATRAGARSLGLRAGAVRVGHWADFLVLDLCNPLIADLGQDRLLDAFVFGGSEEAITHTAVGGNWRRHLRAVQARK